MDFAGDFETHVTVHGDARAVADWAAARGVKFAHIVLERGRVASQPMLTLTCSGTLDDARAQAARTALDLRADGFAAARVKIEAAPWNAGVPAADDEALDPARYFEHHVKLLLAPDAGAAPGLAEVVGPHAAHVSRNARRVRTDGRAERFVTQRCRRVGARTAGARLDALTGALRARGFEIVEVEREFVVFDGDESLDDGWIEERR
ncbi:hypothetical protein [Actinomadura sp. WAC 06369]|uniref:hypothetical protein n=1 Tax=Actinomadura sp. WAC 06369 TaxID=2203193 RepID=UPI000F780A6C|nr:hypothetical protein [Actinomadura sp. WAC 06369]RSN66812.1 hypothetical protein DMH08_15560 [Actinomadura sp. WAC 06369]